MGASLASPIQGAFPAPTASHCYITLPWPGSKCLPLPPLTNFGVIAAVVTFLLRFIATPSRALT